MNMDDFAKTVEDIACALQDKIGTGADERQWQLVGHAAIAAAILEAVRALKPAHDFTPTPNEIAWRERCHDAETEVDRLRAKCKAWDDAMAQVSKECCHEMIAPNNGSIPGVVSDMRSELDRLRAENATLKNEKVRLKAEVKHAVHEASQLREDDKQLTAVRRVLTEQLEEAVFELQRFREREEKVEAMLVVAEKVADKRSGAYFWRENAQPLNDAIVAVRDFKVNK